MPTKAATSTTQASSSVTARVFDRHHGPRSLPQRGKARHRLPRLRQGTNLADSKDKNGKLSIAELQQMIGSDAEPINERLWREMIREADLDGDGEIAYDEFIKMMYSVKDGVVRLQKVAPQP
jgi:hypothetical protein